MAKASPWIALAQLMSRGATNSTDFPTMDPLQPAYGGGTYDAFVTKLDFSGSVLVYSTYLGGSGYDVGGGNGGNGIAADNSGNAYVTGQTTSTNFPTMNPLQLYGGRGDDFVTKINPSGSAIVYSTYLGGSGDDEGYGIAVDSSGNAYVTGTTNSTDFPTMNPLQASNAGGYDAFVSKLNASGSAIVYSTYLGGSGNDNGFGIAVDSSGNAYVTGATETTDFPTMNPLQPVYGGGPHDAFVSKINPSGSGLVYSTYLGGSDEDEGFDIAVDSSGNAYLTGFTLSTNFPTMNPLQPVYGGGEDAFVTHLNPSGSAFVYSTYLGGSGGDYGYGIALDSLGDAYVTGGTSSTDFPTMNPLQPANAGRSDAFVAEIAEPSAAVSLIPRNLDFGNQPVGITSSPQVSTLTNKGELPLTVTSIQVIGPNSSNFGQTNNCTSEPSGGSCQISVTFTPLVTGNGNASVSITDNAPNSPQLLPLTGVGTPPVLTLSPPSLTFGPQPVGTTSQPQIVQLSTSGSLSITSITTSAEFAQTNNCGSSLATGVTCQISVTFTPTASGLQNGTLTITDSGAGSPQAAALSGTGTQPAVTLSPTSLNFGDQTVGTTSSQQVSTLTNTGNIALTIASIKVTGANSRNFAETNNCGKSVAPLGSCSITVTFKPSTTGTRTAAVIITDNASGSAQSLPLAGLGVLPAVKLSPTSLTFPTQVVFTASKTKTATLTNTGLGILNIKSIAATGSFAQTNTCGTTVASGASCTFTVTFKPTTIGTLMGSVSITDNSPASPQKIALTGIGTYVQLSPTSLNFGNQPVGTKSLSKGITLSNKGGAAVSITGISITGTSAADFAQTNTCGSSVAAGASCFIKVTFTPSATGSRTAAVSIGDNGGGSPQKVSLAGTGT